MSDYANWMANSSPALKQKQVYDIIFPASHDSCASELLDVKVSTQGFTYWANKFSWVPGIKKFVAKWTLTQELTTTEQLELGIRAFDWRVSVAPDGRFYFSHSFAVARAIGVIREVADFLETHPGEVIYILAKPDTRNVYNWNQALSNQFASQVIARLSELMVPNDTVNLSLQSLVDNNKRLFFYWSGQMDTHPLIWRRPWGMIQDDYITIESKLERAENFLRSIGKNPNAVNILALTLTPTDTSITNAIKKELAKPCAAHESLQTWTLSMHEVMYAWLEDQSIENIKKLRILTTDFVDTKFVKWIVDFNENN